MRQTLTLEDREGAPDRHAGNAVVLDQFRLGGQLLPFLEPPTGVYKNMTGLIVSLVFRCRAASGAPLTGAETRALRWATREEVIELTDEAYAIRVLDALDAASPPAVRAHDGVKLV
ncbi:hypothetical protein [Streptomyces sp. NPDC058373]|uniref:hypothetical protein n=1 Tax=Streptomyces sp. NPDC058373 TaxID=3346465 RepID=UPI0036562FDA